MTPRLVITALSGLILTASFAALGASSHGARSDRQSAEREDYDAVPMPAGFKVIVTELEGPVFTDAQGKTLYAWPRKMLRTGAAGDNKGFKSQCGDEVSRKTAGLQSPWPAGLLLPDLDTRPSCAQDWPPVLAASDAKPVGKWSIVARNDGKPQWAYDGFPLYTSVLDQQPGDTYGGTKRRVTGEGPALRTPVGPPANVPPEFSIASVVTGRILVTFESYSVYAWAGDSANTSKCFDACLDGWAPVVAPRSAKPRGAWSVVERSPGVWQWAFRTQPLYQRTGPQVARSLDTTDLPPGWRHVFVQRAPKPPGEFTVQQTMVGEVLATSGGKSIYFYSCGDDSLEQLACDHPSTSQALRYVVCGGGDPDVCAKTFPPVPAPSNAKSDSRIWTVISIDPKSGHRMAADQPGAQRVWAYRDRPIYTFIGDEKPGDIRAHSWGEYGGARNGFRAFFLIDDFFGGAG